MKKMQKLSELGQAVWFDNINSSFIEQWELKALIDEGADIAQKQLGTLTDLGIDLGAVTRKLQDDGAASFAKSFETFMESIKEKRDQLLAVWDGCNPFLWHPLLTLHYT